MSQNMPDTGLTPVVAERDIIGSVAVPARCSKQEPATALPANGQSVAESP